MILLLLACGQPPLVDTVEAKLADGVLERAEVPVRLFVAISAIIAESCGVTSVEDYTFVGGGARAMGVDTATVSVLETGDQEWVFSAAGLEDVGAGELTLETTADHGSFEVTYYAPLDIVGTGTIPVVECAVTDADPSEDGIALEGEVATGGSLEFTSDTVTTKAVAEGDKPFAGLHFSPPTAPAPTAGWVQWTDEGSENERGDLLVLDGAQYIDIDADVWPGNVSGLATNGAVWDRDVNVPLP